MFISYLLFAADRMQLCQTI